MSADRSLQEGAVVFPRLDARSLGSARPAAVIDLRSESEFARDHVPGAVNVPLFDDVQRAIVGTLYRQVSPAAAFEEGRTIVRAKIRELVERIARATGWAPDLAQVDERAERLTSGGYERMAERLLALPCVEPPADPIVLHCWRGGLRSQSVVWLVRSLGLERATLLEGGYKGYRAWVNEVLGTARLPDTVVLRGLTGVGKTLVLREIERLRPGSTLDLEALAGHRSSLLGMVGLQPCSQKAFESRLCTRIARGFGPVVFVEGESRKVGDAVVPQCVWEALSGGTNVALEASVERRVEVLCRDYLADEATRAELRERLPHVDARLTRVAGAPSLVELLDSGRERELALLLFERYYDPLYRHGQRGLAFAARFDAGDPTHAAREILAWSDAHWPCAAGALP